MRRNAPLFFAFLLAALPAAGLLRDARAEDPPVSAEEEERLEAVEHHTRRGWEAFRTGNHEEVLARMARLRKYDPESPLPDYLTGRVHERTGRYEEALETASAAAARFPDHRGIEAVRFTALMALGRTDETLTAARAALTARADDLVAQTWLGAALEETGRRKEALEAYDKVVAFYNEHQPKPEEVPYVARAAVRATWLSANPADDMIPGALRLLEKHLKANPEDLDAKLQLADVYQADRGPRSQSLANKFYGMVLKENSEIAEARVGRARAALLFYQQSTALQELDRALQSNPRLVPALSLKAAIHVGNGDYKRAQEALDKALQTNPADKEARSVRAGLHWIRGEKDAYHALEKAVLAEDAHYGEFYRTVAELVGERQRRYEVTIELARKAIEVEPSNRYAYVTLGEALMNRGRTDEALAAFNEGVVKSKKYGDVRRDNWIEVLSLWMPKFKTLETEHFRIRIPLSEWHVMQYYLPGLLEEAHDTLTRKYGVEVENPTYADSFHRADDFSVRSVGSPGLPALGVCFGNTITLLGPTSRPLGSFSWSRTAWHEFAHVVTLQQSKGQVPRWLTEGLSVFEEKQRRDRWGRDMERQLYDRWRNGRLLKMAEINQAFRGPDILFAYFQGGLIADHLMQARGFEVIPRMLRAFAEDKSTAQVFKDVLSLDLDAYDAQFHEYVGTIVGGYKMVPTWDQKSMEAFEARTQKDPSDVEAWIRLAWGHTQRGREIDAGAALDKAQRLSADHPEVLLLRARIAEKADRADLATDLYTQYLAKGEDDLGARMFLAGHLLRTGGNSDGAVAHLEAAKRCFPRYVGRDSPYLQLARLYRGAGQVERAMAELEAYAAIAAEHYGVRRELKTWYRQKKDHATVARICEEMVDISPYGANVAGGEPEPPDMDLHRHYAEALAELGRMDESLRERRVQVAVARLLPEQAQIQAGVIDDHLALGNLLLDRNDPGAALSEAVAALRLDPRHAGALMLKRRAQEASGER